jgi:N-acetylglucosamine malate deacetylase 1
MKLDLLVIAAHPDDAEICVGGILLASKARGARIGIIDMTRGELGTRGNAADRDRETAAANHLLQIDARENLGLPDGRVQVSIDARERLAHWIRHYAPDIVLAQHTQDLHPDHAATGELARQAWYLSGLAKLNPSEAPARRPRRLYHFMGHIPFEPSLVVDIGSVYARKQELVRCYASQLAPAAANDQGQHFLFGADILQRMETRARFYGERIGARYGEPLLAHGPLATQDLLALSL